MDGPERPLTPALSPPAATARQRGESEGEREKPSAAYGCSACYGLLSRTKAMAMHDELQTVTVTVHPSQFPEKVRRELGECLRTRQVNPKFHYDSLKQTQQWLALHEAYSPSRRDADCARVYERSFEAVVPRLGAERVQLIGLGCGGGQKDSRLLKLLRRAGKQASYVPVDVSVAMVLVARQAAMAVLAPGQIFPLVCDLGSADDLPAMVGQAWVSG